MGHALKSIGHGLGSVAKGIGKVVSSYGKSLERVYHDLGNDPINGAIELAGVAFGVDPRLTQSAIDTAKGKQSVEQFARGAGARAAGSYVGGAAGSYVGQQTGSEVGGAAAGGLAGGTAAGVAQGMSAEEALKQGAASGLTAGTTQLLLGNPKSDDPLSGITRGLTSTALSQQFNDLVGTGQNAESRTPPSPFAAIAGGLGNIPNPNAGGGSAAAGGPATVTGGAIDISGSDVNQPRKNVWNTGSLRVKDALGA